MSIVVGIKYWRAEAVSSTNTVTGAWIRMPYDRRVAADFTTTGTPTGTIKMQHRTAGGSAEDTPSATFGSQPAGSALSDAINVNFVDCPGTEFRFVYTNSSGSGTITANVAVGDTMEG